MISNRFYRLILSAVLVIALTVGMVPVYAGSFDADGDSAVSLAGDILNEFEQSTDVTAADADVADEDAEDEGSFVIGDGTGPEAGDIDVGEDPVDDGSVIEETPAVSDAEAENATDDILPLSGNEDIIDPESAEGTVNAEDAVPTPEPEVTAAPEQEILEELAVTGDDAALKSGYYTIVTNLKSDMVMDLATESEDSGIRAAIKTSDKSHSQTFYITNLGNGLYTLRNSYSDRMLGVAGSTAANGVKVGMYNPANNNTQKWYITKSTVSGYYIISSALNKNIVVDVTGGKTTSGTKLQLYTSNGSKAQNWKIKASTNSALSTLGKQKTTAIKSGYYVLKNGGDAGKVLDVKNGSTKDKANVDIYDINDAESQVFYIENVGNGLFKIVNNKSKKALHVSNSSTYEETNVFQYHYLGKACQLWHITISEETGYYVIRSALGDKVLTSDGTDAHCNVAINRFKNSATQRWTLTKSYNYAKVGNGIYTFKAGIGTDKMIEVASGSEAGNANIRIYAANGHHSQKFVVTRKSDGYYSIVNIRSRMALEVAGNKGGNGVNVRQNRFSGADGQKWRFVNAGGGYYCLKSKLGNYCLDIAGGSSDNGTNIQIYKCNYTGAQKFDLTSTSVTPEEGKMYTIKTTLDPAKALDVEGASLCNKANVQIYKFNKTNAQKWRLVKNGSFYNLYNVASGKLLNVKGDGTANGTTVNVYKADNTDGQKWKFVDTGDKNGSFYLINPNGAYLCVNNGSSANGTDVRIYTGTSKTRAQKFYVTDTSRNANGFYTSSGGHTYYYQNNKKLTGVQNIGGVLRYFKDNGVMLRSTTYNNYKIDADGVAVYVATRLKNTVANKTIFTYLSNAMKPVGKTLYIWGGGWSDGGDGHTRDAMIVGMPSTWQTFFKQHAKPDYDYAQYRYNYGKGLDCSGFAGWTLYNTLYKKDNMGWTVYQSSTVADKYIEKGWADPKYSVANPTKLYPGDVVSMDGHVWISLGQCADGSILLVHSSPKGVQISGTAVPSTGAGNSQAYRLAKQYMKKYFPEWPYAVRSVGAGYYKNLKGVAHWKTKDGLLTDPEGIQKMSANQVMKMILGDP